MILAGKVISLLLVFMFMPAMVVCAMRGQAVAAGNVFFTACGLVGFITLQWLL